MPNLPESVATTLAEFKQALLKIYGERLCGVYLYGSYARGDFQNGSDVDLLVVLSGDVDVGAEIDRISPITSDIGLRHDLFLSVLPVPEEWWHSRQSPLFQNLRREAMAL